MSLTSNKNRHDLINLAYKHFTRYERNFIEENLKLGYSRRYIAKKLGDTIQSVCDEINRNSDENGEYRAFHADYF